MKFFGSFIILTIFNLVAVLAGPPPSVSFNSGDIEYTIPGGTDFVVANCPVNKKAKVVTIKPFVNYKGRTYPTKYFNGLFEGSAVERIIFPSGFKNEIYMSGFETAKNLKVIQVDTPMARIYQSYGEYVNRSVLIEGKGVEEMMLQYAKEFLEENNFRGLPKYNPVNTFERQCSLYRVDKFVHNHLKYVPIQYGNNYESGIHTLLYKEGNSLGLARVTRILATAAGYDKNVIRVGGDDKFFGFNFVEFERKWYILDYPFTTYSTMDRDQCHPSFKTSSELIEKLNSFYGKGVRINNNEFVIYHGMFGYNGEVNHQVKENFKNWIKRYNLGTLM